jgi:hypothetical protein
MYVTSFLTSDPKARKEAEQKAAEKGAVTAVSSALSPQASTSHD